MRITCLVVNSAEMFILKVVAFSGSVWVESVWKSWTAERSHHATCLPQPEQASIGLVVSRLLTSATLCSTVCWVGEASLKRSHCTIDLRYHHSVCVRIATTCKALRCWPHGWFRLPRTMASSSCMKVALLPLAWIVSCT